MRDHIKIYVSRFNISNRICLNRLNQGHIIPNQAPIRRYITSTEDANKNNAIPSVNFGSKTLSV